MKHETSWWMDLVLGRSGWDAPHVKAVTNGHTNEFESNYQSTCFSVLIQTAIFGFNFQISNKLRDKMHALAIFNPNTYLLNNLHCSDFCLARHTFFQNLRQNWKTDMDYKKLLCESLNFIIDAAVHVNLMGTKS